MIQCKVIPPENDCALEIHWGTEINCGVGYSSPMYDNGLVCGIMRGVTTVRIASGKVSGETP